MLRMTFTLLAAACTGTVIAAPPPQATAGWEWGAKIPLRDGVKLNATLYKPAAGTADPACVFTLTPYISQTYHARGQYFSQHGYAFLTVDVRGRGNSEGRFTPMLQEVDDVRDVVDWLARQPYCNGKVAMWGGSYAGYDQWLAAKWRQPALRSIAPAASAWPGIDFPSNSNIYRPYDVMWLALTNGKTAQDNLFDDIDYWDSKVTEWVATNRPFAGFDTDFGIPHATFQEWLAHPSRDKYWDDYAPAPQDFAQMDLPILSIVGQFDHFTLGAMRFYQSHMQQATAAAKAKHYLVLGPWNHAGTRTPTPRIGQLEIGQAGMLDLNALHKAWYDWTLRGGDKPAFLKKRVAYYMLGAGTEEWRYADTLDEITREQRPYYLASDQGQANDVFRSGRLDVTAPTSTQAPDIYVDDPLRTMPQPRIYDYAYLTDHLVAMQAYGRSMLVYHSAPFEQATEIAGIPRLKVWLSIDQPDVDLHVWLYEVKPDGTAAILGLDAMRARYRTSDRVAKRVVPGTVEPYEFDQFSFVGRRLQQGSRLRLVIGPTPRTFYERNFNGGGVVAKESGKDARRATVTLHHDAERPSALYLPLARAAEAAAPGR